MNFGVAVVRQSPGSLIDPFVLGAKDESSVQGYVGTPVNINSLTAGYQLPIGAAGARSSVAGRYYISVDSGRSPFTGQRLAGTYRLRYWVNDLRRPSIRVLTTRVAAGRPTIAVQILDAGSGVDPFSLVLSYGQVLVGASGYDRPPASRFPAAGRSAETSRPSPFAFLASDNQEGKNANSYGGDVMPNTRIVRRQLRVVRGAALLD